MQKKAEFLTIAQAARFLKVSPDTLRRWEDRGIVTPLRTKGGSRRYTLLDLKIAKLNKKKTRFFQIPTLLRQNYINSKQDLKIALITSFLWVLGLLAYHFLTPIVLQSTNPEQQILSDELKEQTHLKVASQTTSKISAVTVLVLPAQSSGADEIIPGVVSPEPNLLILKFNSLPSLQFKDNPDQYYSLKPLPQNQNPTLIKRI